MTSLSRAPAVAAALFSLWCALLAPPAAAQFTTVINVPPDLELDRIEPGTQVNVDAGGVLSTTASRIEMEAAELNINGASVDEAVNAINYSTINVHNGYIKTANALSGSKLTLQGSTAGRLSAEMAGQLTVLDSEVSSIGVGDSPPPRGTSDEGGTPNTLSYGSIVNSSIGSLSVQMEGRVELRNSNLDGGLTVRGGSIDAYNSDLSTMYVGELYGHSLTPRTSVANLHSSQAERFWIGPLGTVYSYDTDFAEPVELAGGAALNHYSGSIAQLFVTRWGDSDFRKSVANVYGGHVGPWSEVNRVGILNIYGGEFDSRLRVHGGEAHFYGGTIGDAFFVGAEGSLHWHGGEFTGRTSFGDADVFIYGTAFALLGNNGFEPLTHLALNEPQRFTDNNATLRIHRADGSVYDAVLSSLSGSPDIYVAPSATIHLVLVRIPEPATITLALLAILASSRFAPCRRLLGRGR